MFSGPETITAGERLLWLAVLRRAIFDYVLYKGVGHRALDWKRAFQYIFVPGFKNELGLSFTQVCELFGWEPDYVRRLVNKLTREDVKKMDVSRIREELIFGEIAHAARRNERWVKKRAQAFSPFFQTEDEEPLTTFQSGFVPIIEWQASA